MRLMITLVLVSFASLSAAEWPCWRGPGGLGVSTEKNLPTEWSKDKNIGWKTPLPGSGASSPIVFGDRVYVTVQTSDTGLHILAFDAKSGNVLWDREVGFCVKGQ